MANEGAENKGSVVAGAVWMLVISLILFWLPVIGPLVGGFVGGKRAGSVGGAILAVLLPAIVVGVFLFTFATALTGFPLIGAVAGSGGFILCLTGIGPMLVGALIGGAMA